MRLPWRSIPSGPAVPEAETSLAGQDAREAGWASWLLVVPPLMVIVLALKAFGVPAPIYAGDEYAYWRNGIMLWDREALYAADPAMQQIDNKIYCLLMYATDRLAPGNLLLPCLINTAAWAGVIALVHRTAAMLVSPRDAAVAAALTAVMPIGLTAGTLMADVPLGLGYWLILHQLVRRAAAPLHWPEAAMVCGLSALLLGVKPHAIVLPAAYVLASLMRVGRGSGLAIGGSVRRWALGLAAGAIAFGAVHVGSEGFGPRQSQETAGLGQIYNDLLMRSLSPEFLTANLTALGRAAARHASVLALLFALPLVALACGCRPFGGPTGRPATRQAARLEASTCFILASLVLFVLMTSVFGALAQSGNPFERDRLHERYYWFLLPAIVVGGLAMRRHAEVSPRLTRIAAMVTLLMVLLHAATSGGGCRLYPWDAPDVYGLYASPNTYWGQPAAMRHGRHLALVACGLAGLAGIVRPRLMWPCSLAALGLTFAVGWVGVLDWQHDTSRNHTARLEETRDLAAGIGARRVQAIGTERFGPFAAHLFGLSGNPLVTITADEVVTAEDIAPQAEAVFVTGRHEFRPPYAWKISGRTGTIYALVDRGPFNVARSPGAPADDPSGCTFLLGDSVRNVGLFGFNEAEPWGAWSAISPAEIVLPRHVEGRVRVTWKGFVAEENAGADVRLRIGSGVITRRMTTTPAEYGGECDVGEATDRIFVECPIFRPNTWSRPLGMGLMDVTIEMLPDAP